VGQHVGTASGGVPVTISHVDGTVIQPSSAEVVCEGTPTHRKPLDHIWSNGTMIFQYPKQGPCEWGVGEHVPNPPLDADPEPRYHVEAVVEGDEAEDTTLCSGSFDIYDAGGAGYPKPPMSP